MSEEEKREEDEELLPETVKTNIELGWFEVAFDTAKGASSAYDVIQKVFYRKIDGGGRVGNWFFCSRCGNAWEHDASMGSAPNVRHKEKTCKGLTDDQRKKYAEESKARKDKKKLTKGNAKSAPKSKSSTEATKNVPLLPENKGPSNSQVSNTPSDGANESQVSTEATTSKSQTSNEPNLPELPENTAASGSTISNDTNDENVNEFSAESVPKSQVPTEATASDSRIMSAPNVSQVSTEATTSISKTSNEPNLQEDTTVSDSQTLDVANKSQVPTEAATPQTSDASNLPELPENTAASESTIPNVTNMAQLQLEVKYSHTANELFDLIEKSSEMGIVYGKIDAKKLKKSSIKPGILDDAFYTALGEFASKESDVPREPFKRLPQNTGKPKRKEKEAANKLESPKRQKMHQDVAKPTDDTSNVEEPTQNSGKTKRKANEAANKLESPKRRKMHQHVTMPIGRQLRSRLI